MDVYRHIRDEINAGKDVRTVASELDLSKSRIYAMISAMRKAGITINLHRAKLAPRFAHLLAEERGELPGSTRAAAEAPAKQAKLTAEQAETLPHLRAMFNEPEGTYEELSARMKDDPVKRDMVESNILLEKLNAETPTPRTEKAPLTPDMQAKLNALFGVDGDA